MSIPSITRIARFLGDTSAISKPELVPARFFNRGIGRLGGKAIGIAKNHFGILGLVAIAEFFSALQTSMRLSKAKEIWFGSMTNYADWVDGGWRHHSSGKETAPFPFLTAAIHQVQAEDMGLGGFGALYKTPSKGASGTTKIRSGVYEGQKFLGDWGQFYKDSSLSGLAGRAVRRESGRQVSGFLFNFLRTKQNPMEQFAKKVLRLARKNLVGKEETGMLRASLAWGHTEYEFIQASIQKAERAGVRAGLTEEQIHRKLATTMSGSGYRYSTLVSVNDQPGPAE